MDTNNNPQQPMGNSQPVTPQPSAPQPQQQPPQQQPQNPQRNYGYGYSKRPLWQWILLYVIIAAVAYGAIYYFFFYNKGSNSGVYQTPSTQNQTQTQTANGTYVHIKGMAFTPATLTVKKGTTVIWVNDDTVDHTVTADKDGPMSPTLSKGATYSDTFTSAGSYAYHCAIHPNMKGTIIVTN